ncbi:MAG: hypothetical protein NVS9B9_29950 [Ktedonobacteraceae bacterium]
MFQGSTVDQRHCPACGLDKPSSEFAKRNKNKPTYHWLCKRCHTAENMERYRKKHPGSAERLSLKMEGLKRCKKCLQVKSEDEYYRAVWVCKRCTYLDKVHKKYGVSPEEYNETVAKQEGRCAICRVETQSFHTDHDHENLVFSGLLCMSCNHGIGKFYDNPELLLAAAQYLQKGKKVSNAAVHT